MTFCNASNALEKPSDENQSFRGSEGNDNGSTSNATLTDILDYFMDLNDHGGSNGDEGTGHGSGIGSVYGTVPERPSDHTHRSFEIGEVDFEHVYLRLKNIVQESVKTSPKCPKSRKRNFITRKKQLEASDRTDNVIDTCWKHYMETLRRLKPVFYRLGKPP